MIWNMRRRKKKPKLKWYFNDTVVPITTSTIRFGVAFRSADGGYSGMRCDPVKIGNEYLVSKLMYMGRPFNTTVWERGRGWVTEGYRTVEFEKEPTGELLRFLQQNATPL
nr:MAG TPA: hypothetical protein [Caudoviricetes sp.]